MDRLLTDEEIRGIVQNTPAGVYDYKAVAQAQDDLTASLVAQEIFKDYENAFEPTVPMSITYEKHHAIKSKWGIEC